MQLNSQEVLEINKTDLSEYRNKRHIDAINKQIIELNASAPSISVSEERMFKRRRETSVKAANDFLSNFRVSISKSNNPAK